MHLKLIRNATIRLDYGGHTFLVDPSLDPVGAWAPMDELLNPQPNPIADLPEPAADVVDGVDAVLLTHTHLDHFDPTARSLIPHATPFLHQPSDGDLLTSHGFTSLVPVGEEATSWNDIEVVRTHAQHGFGVVAELLGPASGFVLRAASEPTVYIAGDTVWCPAVETALAQEHPDVVVVNAADARLSAGNRIIMDATDVHRVLEAAPKVTVVAVHLEAISHCILTRDGLRASVDETSGRRLLIPADGETIYL